MATIDTDVPVELDVDSMRVGEPDVDALRALFTELEFTSLLKELLPVVEVSGTEYSEAKSAADVEAVLKGVGGAGLSVAIEQAESVPVRRRGYGRGRTAGRRPAFADGWRIERTARGCTPPHGDFGQRPETRPS